ncbi:MAG: class I SAM-dependent methyltransferase [Wenzhouxiangella sp.]
MKRTPEPELMDAPEQARAYAEADFEAPNQLFVSLFVPLVEADANSRLIDLGCGPGDICIRLARLLPQWHITGLDAGPNMLSLAGDAVKRANLVERIELLLAHLPDEVPPGRFDAITSNSLLHHLPDSAALWDSITRLARPGCVVQIMDLHRPADRDAAAAIVDLHAADAPEVLRQDFYNSLLAAYTADEVETQMKACGLDGLALTRPTDRHWLVQGRIES